MAVRIHYRKSVSALKLQEIQTFNRSFNLGHGTGYNLIMRSIEQGAAWPNGKCGIGYREPEISFRSQNLRFFLSR
jgi:hypothetical protein